MNNLVKQGDPLFEAVSVDDLKKHLYVYHSADDAYIGALAVAARQQVEADLNQVVVGQEFDLYTELASIPSCLSLPVQPVQEVTEITYLNADSERVTLDPSYYTVKTYKNPAEIVFTDAPSGSEPIVTFVAGYSDPVPQIIKQAVMFLVKIWYDLRTPVSETSMNVVPLAYERIINRQRVMRFV